MGALYKYRKDGYVFEDPLSSVIPWPIAKIDKSGNEIPLTMEEINSWRDDYLKKHPHIMEKLGKTEVSNDPSLLKKILLYMKLKR